MIKTFECILGDEVDNQIERKRLEQSERREQGEQEQSSVTPGNCDECGQPVDDNQSECPCGAVQCQYCETFTHTHNPDTDACEDCTLDRAISRAEAMRDMR